MKIILSALAALLLLGCSEDKASSAKEESAQKTNVTVETIKAPSVESNTTAHKIVKEVTKTLNNETKEIAQVVEKKSTSVVKDINKTVQEVKKDLTKVVEPAKAPVVTIDAAAIYKTCATCHGLNAEKKALNKSQIIKGWDSAKIVAALHGYKDGSYGSSMKGVMKPQVSKLSDAEIEAVAKYISNL